MLRVIEARRQLELIAFLTALLAREGIDHWLFGGWAVDFVTGEQARRHRDVDFVVWRSDRQWIGNALFAEGFVEVERGHADEGSEWRSARGDLELVHIERNDRGEIVTPGRYAASPWPAESFDLALRTFGHVTCPVVDVSALIHWKSNQARSVERSYGAEDAADLARLRRLLD